MVKNNSRLFIFLALLLSNNVFAEWYVGGQYSYTFLKFDAPGAQEFNPTALMLRGGYDLTDNIAFELRLGTGLMDSERDNPNIQTTISIDSAYGGYLKLQMSYETITPYVLVGYTKSTLDAESSLLGIDIEVEDEDVSFGLGIEGPLSETLFVTFEYMRYYDENDITIDAFGIGLIARY